LLALNAGGELLLAGLDLVPKPIVSALLGAVVGGNLLRPGAGVGVGSSIFAVLVLEGSCGLEGNTGLGSLCTAAPLMGTIGALFVETNGAFLSFSNSFCSCACFLLGGKGGNFASPNIGGNFLPFSTELALVVLPPVFVLVNERVD
jgi:hypothetical protein